MTVKMTVEFIRIGGGAAPMPPVFTGPVEQPAHMFLVMFFLLYALDRDIFYQMFFIYIKTIMEE